MTLPAILFGLALAWLVGAAYHTVRGGNGWRLLLFLSLSVAGFALGQFVGPVFGWVVFKFGVLDLGIGVIGSLLMIILGDWLSHVQPKQKSGV